MNAAFKTARDNIVAEKRKVAEVKQDFTKHTPGMDLTPGGSVEQDVHTTIERDKRALEAAQPVAAAIERAGDVKAETEKQIQDFKQRMRLREAFQRASAKDRGR